MSPLLPSNASTARGIGGGTALQAQAPNPHPVRSARYAPTVKRSAAFCHGSAVSFLGDRGRYVIPDAAAANKAPTAKKSKAPVPRAQTAGAELLGRRVRKTKVTSAAPPLISVADFRAARLPPAMVPMIRLLITILQADSFKSRDEGCETQREAGLAVVQPRHDVGR